VLRAFLGNEQIYGLKRSAKPLPSFCSPIFLVGLSQPEGWTVLLRWGFEATSVCPRRENFCAPVIAPSRDHCHGSSSIGSSRLSSPGVRPLRWHPAQHELGGGFEGVSRRPAVPLTAGDRAKRSGKSPSWDRAISPPPRSARLYLSTGPLYRDLAWQQRLAFTASSVSQLAHLGGGGALAEAL